MRECNRCGAAPARVINEDPLCNYCEQCLMSLGAVNAALHAYEIELWAAWRAGKPLPAGPTLPFAAQADGINKPLDTDALWRQVRAAAGAS